MFSCLLSCAQKEISPCLFLHILPKEKPKEVLVNLRCSCIYKLELKPTVSDTNVTWLKVTCIPNSNAL